MKRAIMWDVRRVVVGMTLAASVALLGGCGAEKGPALEKAGGVVMYKNAPVKGATVSFVYANGDLSTGSTDDQGKFTMSTGGREGALIGKPKVTVSKTSSAYAAAPKNPTYEDMMKMSSSQGQNMKSAEKPKDELPAKYGNPAETELVADIKSGVSNLDLKFDLKD